MWHTIGPYLAQYDTVIAVNLRGMGQSTIPSSYDFTSATSEDLNGILDFLNINQTYLVAHDKGGRESAALNAEYRSPVKRAICTEFARLSRAWCGWPTPEVAACFFPRTGAAQDFIQGQ